MVLLDLWNKTWLHYQVSLYTTLSSCIYPIAYHQQYPGYPGKSQYFQGSYGYGYGYPIYYPGTYGYGYQYPSYYSGLYAKYVKDSTEKQLARFKIKSNKIFVLFPLLIFSTESSRLIRASTDDFAFLASTEISRNTHTEEP